MPKGWISGSPTRLFRRGRQTGGCPCSISAECEFDPKTKAAAITFQEMHLPGSTGFPAQKTGERTLNVRQGSRDHPAALYRNAMCIMGLGCDIQADDNKPSLIE